MAEYGQDFRDLYELLQSQEPQQQVMQQQEVVVDAGPQAAIEVGRDHVFRHAKELVSGMQGTSLQNH